MIMITEWECHHSSSAVCQQLSKSAAGSTVTSWLIVRTEDSEGGVRPHTVTNRFRGCSATSLSRHRGEYGDTHILCENTPSSNTESFLCNNSFYWPSLVVLHIDCNPLYFVMNVCWLLHVYVYPNVDWDEKLFAEKGWKISHSQLFAVYLKQT